MQNLTVGSAADWPAPVQTALVVLRFALVAFFLFVAAKNLSGDAQMAAEFQRWGYPDWFRVVTAGIQLTGALLLLVPGTRVMGAALLAIVMLGALGTHLMHDPPSTLVAPAAFLLLVATQFAAAPARG